MAASYTFKDPNFNEHRTQRFNHFRKANKFIDCRIVVGSTVIPCHALIVSAASPVFESMIESEMTEGLSGELHFPTLDPSTVELIVDYIYTGLVVVQKEEALEVVQTCDYLQLTSLKDYVLQFVSDLLAPENAASWLQFLLLLDIHPLAIRRCQNMMTQFIKRASQNSDFLQLNKREIETCVRNALSGSSPIAEVLDALLAWIQFDVPNRIDVLDAIISSIKYTHCKADSLQFIHEQYTVILELKPEFQQALKGIGFENLQEEFVILGGYENTYCWVLSNNRFQTVAQIPEDIFAQYQSICQYAHDCLILTSGLNSTTCVMYNTMTKQWRRLADIESARRRHASDCFFAKVFIFGGFGVEGWTTSVQMLDLAEENSVWKPTSPVPATLENPKCARLASAIFLMGDHNPQLHAFDVASLSWSMGGTLHCDPGSDFSVASGGESLYIAGGSRNILCVYTSLLESWTQVSPPNHMHQNAALFFNAGSQKLVILGGSFSDVVEEYDCEKDDWSEAPYKLPCAQQSHFAFMVSLLRIDVVFP